MGITSTYLTERPDSPQITGDKDGRKLTRIYTMNNSLIGELDSLLPATGAFDESADRDGYFMQYRTTHGPGYTTVYLDYVSDLENPNIDKKVNLEVKYSLSVNIVEKMLEECYNAAGTLLYRTKWNYNLFECYAKGGTKSAVPAWAATATTFSDATGKEEAGQYVWSKDTKVSCSDSTLVWDKVQDKTKPGVEAYVIAQAIVTAQKFCKRKSEAEAYLKTGVGLSTPAERFGWGSSGSNHWLVYPIGIQNDGEFWVAVNEYHYADKWDTDLYSAI